MEQPFYHRDILPRLAAAAAIIATPFATPFANPFATPFAIADAVSPRKSNYDF